jgi:hypothetical protein
MENNSIPNEVETVKTENKQEGTKKPTADVQESPKAYKEFATQVDFDNHTKEIKELAKTKAVDEILKRLGIKSIDDIDDINAIIESSKTAEEKAAEEWTKLGERLKTSDSIIAELESENLSLKLAESLREAGYTGKELKAALYDTASKITDTDSIAAVIEEYTKSDPPTAEQQKAGIEIGSGVVPQGAPTQVATEATALQAKFDEAKKNRNGVLMTAISREAANKKIKLK